MISQAIYYQTFIPSQYVINNGLDFTRILQSINSRTDGFNLILASNWNGLIGNFLSYILSDSSNIIGPGIYMSSIIGTRNENFLSLDLNYPIIMVDINKVESLLRNNRIKKFILDTEKIISKADPNSSFYESIDKRIQEIKNIIQTTNLENFKIHSSQIILKLVCIFSYTKMLSETLPCSKVPALLEFNNYTTLFIKDVTRDLGFKSLNYKVIKNFYIVLHNLYIKLVNYLLRFRLNSQIYFAKYLSSIYFFNIASAFNSLFLTIWSINMYILVYLLVVLFILISIFIKSLIYSFVWIF